MRLVFNTEVGVADATANPDDGTTVGIGALNAPFAEVSKKFGG